MPYQRERTIAAFTKVKEAKDNIGWETWAVKAGLAPRTLAFFIEGRIKSMKVETLIALAEAVDVHPSELLGVGPPPISANEVASLLRSFRSEISSLDHRLAQLQAGSPERPADEGDQAPSEMKYLPAPSRADQES